jgi:zinc protease
LFGDTGYGLDVLGTEESVTAIQVPDLKAFHEKYARPDNCVLAIFGDVKAPDVHAAVEKAFAKWERSQAALTLDFRPQTLDSVKRVTETRDKKQAVLLIGYQGTNVSSPDRYPLEILQEACSDLGSRLFLRIREELGLAYYVGAQNFIGLAPGYFTFYTGTMPEKAELVELELLNEAELLRKKGLTEEELNRAKAKIIGQKKIARQDLGGLAMATALDELYGLGYAHADKEDGLYQAVTAEQIVAVAQKHLRSDAFVVSVVKPAAGAS